jgi:hypothetical protein
VEAEHFVHVLLFECRNCHRPLAAPVLSSQKNPEEVDAAGCHLECLCSWSGRLLGVEAMRHWVMEWKLGAPKEDGPLETGAAN